VSAVTYKACGLTHAVMSCACRNGPGLRSSGVTVAIESAMAFLCNQLPIGRSARQCPFPLDLERLQLVSSTENADVSVDLPNQQ
jgi:hypothetical protein